jgi:hypothetical protein
VLINTLIEQGALTTYKTLDESKLVMEKALSEGLWGYFIDIAQVSPAMRPIAEAVRTGIQDGQPFTTTLKKPVSKSLATLTTQKLRAKTPFDTLIEDIINIALNDYDTPDEPINALKLSLAQAKDSYLNNLNYTDQFKSYLTQLSVTFKKPSFWNKPPLERKAIALQLSEDFLGSYINPKVTRRQFLGKLIPLSAKQEDVLKTATPSTVLSDEPENTKLSRRALPVFIILDKILKCLGKN